MMQYYVVDAFTDSIFKGNPAGICVLEENISTEIMQNIATENNLSETAFVRKHGNGYDLRWFTPKFEIDLCGHATLATAFVISNFIDIKTKTINFFTKSGYLEVKRNNSTFEMVLPNRKPEKIDLTKNEINYLNCLPCQIYSSRDLIIILDNEQDVINYRPDYNSLKNLNTWLGIIITAKGTGEIDFVSRYFCPEMRMEDPVTGSSHCSLIPLWAEKLEKNKLTAVQLSKRKGTLYCELLDDNAVQISGEAKLFLQGEIFI